MNRKLSILGMALTAAIGLQAEAAPAFAGAGSRTESSTISSAHAEAVYKAALPLFKSYDNLPEAISYVNRKIYALEPYQATLLTLKLENTHKAGLGSWEDKLGSSEIQRKLTAIYKPGMSMAMLAKATEDMYLRKLLESASESGYKLEHAEGGFFPVIDYGAYRKYKMYVTDDIRDYITIMATESDLPSTKDSGLIIAWSEVATRALTLEKFILSHPNSNRLAAVTRLYNKYETYTFYGLSNTPLFHYDNLEMDLEARKAYSGILAKHEDRTPYLEKLHGFVKLLKDNDYKLVDQVEKYRSNSS